MMVSDSTHTPPGRLDEETVRVLRDALRAYLADSGNAVPLRDALVQMAGDARGKAILPEQLLVVLKDVWQGLSEVRAMHDIGAQISLQQRVVTMCIKEYYSA